MEIHIELPHDKRTRRLLEQDPAAFVASQLKKGRREVYERRLTPDEKEEFKAELEEKNAALKHFKKLCEKQRRKIEEMSLKYEKREKRFQETETAFVRHSETEIEELSRRSQNLNHEEYGAFLEKMMESCSEATARAVRLCVCVCICHHLLH